LKYGADELPIMSEYEWFSNQIQMTCLYEGADVSVPHGPAALAVPGAARLMPVITPATVIPATATASQRNILRMVSRFLL
jgi:hypothetical protein